jgi:hypothetical protein
MQQQQSERQHELHQLIDGGSTPFSIRPGPLGTVPCL